MGFGDRGGGFRGRGGGGGGRGSFRGGRGGGGFQRDMGPPDYVDLIGTFEHPAENLLVCKASNLQTVPFFNAPIYNEAKVQMGKIDDVFGPTANWMFSVTPDESVKAKSLKVGTQLFIDPARVLPLSRFTSTQSGGVSKKPAGARGGRGGFGSRGGFGGRFHKTLTVFRLNVN